MFFGLDGGSFSLGLGWAVFTIDELLCDFTEEKMDVITTFRRYLNIWISIFLSIFFDLFFTNLPLRDIRFISNQKYHGILSSRLSDKIKPFIDSIKGGTYANIDDYETNIGISNIARDESSKALLASCIPELQS